MYLQHGTMFSYYSAKTRAFLGYKRLPYVELYDPDAYRERIAPALGRTVIPVVETGDGEILQDTTVIIDVLEARHPERPVFPADPVLMLLTRIVEFFIDELWVATAMHTRWNDANAKRFAIAEFNQVFGRGEPGLTWSNGDAVAEKMQSYLPNLGIADAAGQRQIQRLFVEATAILNRAVGPRQFAFGARPTLVDLCLYEGYFAHHYRDYGAAQAHLKSQAPALCYFIDVLHAAHGAPDSGEVELTDAFGDYLRYIGPLGAAYAHSVTELAAPLLSAAGPDDVLANPLTPQIELFGAPYQRGCNIFSAWKAQRVHDTYAALPDAQRRRADMLVADIGWAEVLAAPPAARMERVDFALRLAV